MPSSNQFLPFANSSSANVLNVTAYGNLSTRTGGFVAGLLPSQHLNTPLRQATFVTASLAQYVADTGNTSVNDDGNVTSFVAKLTNAINITAASGGLLSRDGSLPMLGPLTLSGNASSALQSTPLQQVDGLIAAAVSAIPSGAVVHFARNTAPSGWLAADGSAISRTTYSALFTAIGTAFGIGDGTTTFNIPDLRGEFMRGWDNGRGVDSGRAFGTAQADAMQGHRHSPLNAQFANSASNIWSQGGGIYGGLDATTGNPTTDTVNGTPRTAAETRSRNIALLACIKY